MKGGKQSRTDGAEGTSLHERERRKIGRRPRSFTGGLSLTGLGDSPPSQANSSAPKATFSGRTRPLRHAGERGPTSGTDRSEAEPESTRSSQARRRNVLDKVWVADHVAIGIEPDDSEQVPRRRRFDVSVDVTDAFDIDLSTKRAALRMVEIPTSPSEPGSQRRPSL